MTIRLIIISEPILYVNEDFSVAFKFFQEVFFSFLSLKLIRIVLINNSINVKVILFKKATSGRNVFNKTDIGMVNRTVQRAALFVVFFQNKPVKNMQRTPGVTKPHFC